MATTSFVADVNKTVTVEGITYTITAPSIPEGLTVRFNEVELKPGVPVELTDNMSITFDMTPVVEPTLMVAYASMNTFTLNGQPIANGSTVTLANGSTNVISATGATSIPPVTITGSGISAFTVNSTAFTPNDLPYTFTPTGGITNSINVTGADTTRPKVTLNGTNIASATANGTAITLPYSHVVTEDALDIAVSGEIYQVDVASVGGVQIKKDGVIISDGNAGLHQIIDVTKDTYLSLDGTHTLTVNGTQIKSISVNGIEYPAGNLPVNIKNSKMTASVVANGYAPSEVHITGDYMETVTIDGENMPLTGEGHFEAELTTVDDNHFINMVGLQPREYGITFDDNGSTTMELDGKAVEDGTTKLIAKDVLVAAWPEPIPIHFDNAAGVIVEINGREFAAEDFTYNISNASEIDILTNNCILTIDYGDNSYQLIVPQAIVTIAAPHRDGWLFQNWSSSDLGIDSPQSVRTSLNLMGKSTGHLVATYKRCITETMPNAWN